jgi:hypothetical protein
VEFDRYPGIAANDRLEKFSYKKLSRNSKIRDGLKFSAVAVMWGEGGERGKRGLHLILKHFIGAFM